VGVLESLEMSNWLVHLRLLDSRLPMMSFIPNSLGEHSASSV